MVLDIQVLGHPSVKTRSGDHDAPGPKLLALAAFLALRHGGAGVRRSELIGVFWPDSREDRARTALRQALMTVRRQWGGSVVTSDDGGIRLRREAVRCDVWDFEHHLRAGAAEQALGQYRGDLLLGFDARCTPEWESWVDRRRQTLREQACEAHWVVARRQYAAGRVRESISHVRKALALRPFDERGMRQLMLMLAAQGDRASALREYEVFANTLKTELSVPPDPQTRELRERIVAGNLEDRPCFEPAGTHGGDHPWAPMESWR